MFRFTLEPSSGSQCQCLAKITGIVPLCLSICALSVFWRHMTPEHRMMVFIGLESCD